jgi:hypothetical protein
VLTRRSHGYDSFDDPVSLPDPERVAGLIRRSLEAPERVAELERQAS